MSIIWPETGEEKEEELGRGEGSMEGKPKVRKIWLFRELKKLIDCV